MASAEAYSGPVTGDAEGEEHNALERFFRRLGIGLLLALGPAAILYLAFNKGGYFPNTDAFAAILLAQALVLRVLLSEHPFASYSRALAIPLIALTAFDALQLASALWSHATARALDEYVRTLIYLLAFALLGSLPRTWFRMQWLVRLMALALSVVCLAGLISRLLPHLWPTASSFYSDRLSYPLTYWNALGVTAAMATVLLFHLGASLKEPRAVRIIAAALVPATATTLLLTYSRGAIAVAILGLIIYVSVGRPRGLLTAAAAVVPTSAVALHSGYDAILLSGNHPTSHAAVVEGRHVAIIVGLCLLVAAVLRLAFCLLLDRRLATTNFVPARVRRLPYPLLIGAPLAVLLVVLLALGAPGYVSHQWHEFIGNDKGPTETRVRERLTDPASNGRAVLWKESLKQFSSDPLAGQGARTFQFYFMQHRTDGDTVTDAHNLYLQTLGEQGIVGLMLLLVVVVSVLVALARRCRGAHRSLFAALLAVGLTWAVHATVDWDWEMPAVTVVFFVIGGAALASRASESHAAATPTRNATAIAICVLALAVGPAFVGISYQRAQAAASYLKNGNCTQAKKLALGSITALAVRPEPYEILGYCDLELGFPTEALSAMRQAVSNERENWNYHYGLALALAANGQNPIPEARRALQLNPKEPLVKNEVAALERARPLSWPQDARRLLLQSLQSGVLAISNL